ncbi:MAG TPA: MarR family transcriptional regulator [Dietzia timorensis]|uniref:MarR family transcriptional regulator n=1 Tax=Dietzia timorensis TaxID=499555 RepID=A0A921JYY3_9ACTN|nr:MarR family transcriptional regulator [Dietzia timorensis]HJE91368.1 MarR family transcriptional regulator [Dietzia timorensis]
METNTWREGGTTEAPSDDNDQAGQIAQQLRTLVMRFELLSRRNRSTFPLSHSQLSMLSTLSKHGSLRMTELARYENVRVPTVSNAVSTLEGLGLVCRVSTDHDRRVVNVALTPAGRRAVKESTQQREAYFAETIAELPEDKREELHRAIPAVHDLLQHIEKQAG